jgi:Protein kinase domain
MQRQNSYHPEDRRGLAMQKSVEVELEELPEAPQAPIHSLGLERSLELPSQPAIIREHLFDESFNVPNSPPLSPSSRSYQGCSSISNYKLGQQIGSGTFGNVIIAIEKSSGKKFALKNIKLNSEKEGMPMTAMREIRILKKLANLHVIKLHEIAVRPGNRGLQETYMVLL